MGGLRTTVVLAVIALGLLAFILIFERGTITSGELAQREGRVLTHFIRKRVSELEIVQGDQRVVLERGPDPENDEQLGLWRMVEPIRSAADEDAVDVLLGELEWMDARRQLNDISAEDRSRFGLDDPEFRVRYRIGSTTGHLKVGKLSPMSDGHYAQADDPKVAYVVGKDLYEALDHPPAHYHSKELHDGLLMMTVERLEVSHAGKTRVIAKQGKRFWMTEPSRGWASRPSLSTFFETLDRLEAKRYIAEKPASGEYGLDQPRMVARVTKKAMIESEDPDEKPRFESRTLVFRLGAACGAHADESYFMVGESGPVMCISDPELEPALAVLDNLREQRLLPLDDNEIRSVKVVEGKAVLHVTRASDGSDDGPPAAEAEESPLAELGLADPPAPSGDGTWRYALEGSGEGIRAKGVAQRNTVSSWFSFLRAAEVLEFDQGDAQAPLGAPRVVASFALSGKDAAYEIAFHDTASALLVRRADEPQLMSFPREVVTSLRASVSPFRNRKLLSQEGVNLQQLRVQRGATTEIVSRDAEGKFHVREPIDVAADSVISQELARLLAGLEVLQFIADAPAPEHGLDEPEIVLTFTLASADGEAEQHRLRIGEPAVGGHYGQLGDDPTVFIVPHVIVSKLASPLVSRTGLSVPLSDIRGVQIEAGSARCEITRRDGAFAYSGEEPSEAAADLTETLATLRARDVAPYGTPLSAEGPSASLVVRVAGDRSHTLQLFDDGGEGTIAARRADLDVTFMIDRGHASELAACP